MKGRSRCRKVWCVGVGPFVLAVLLVAGLAPGVWAADLEQGFATPPDSARPHT